MIKPHCPECKSTDKPHSKITGLKGVRTLIVYCSACGCILGAVPYVPTPGSGVGSGEYSAADPPESQTSA